MFRCDVLYGIRSGSTVGWPTHGATLAGIADYAFEALVVGSVV